MTSCASLVAIICGLSVCLAFGERTLKYTSNPGCLPAECSSTTRLASVSIDTNTSHDITYLWSSVGAPGMVVAYTNEADSVDVKWNASDSARPVSSLTMHRQYSMAVLVTRLIAVNTTTYVPGVTPPHYTFELSQEKWWANEATTDTDQAAVVNMSAPLRSFGWDDFVNFTIKFSSEVDEGRESQLPRLKYTENSTRLEISFNGWADVNATDPFVLDAKNKGLNFVLELLLVPDPKNKAPPSDQPFDLTSGRSLDDEYTPSQFWHSTVTNEADRGFVYWKPIIYTSLGSRSIANSVPVDTVDNSSTSFFPYNDLSASDTLPYSVASLLYGDTAASDAQYLYLSFNATTSTAQVWNVIIGVGDSPKDEISLMVILIIAFGLGLPGLVLIFGVPGASLYKRYKNKKCHSGYTTIQ